MTESPNPTNTNPTNPEPVSRADAALALDSIEQRRRQVIAEIDVPPWYWWAVALGWVALGMITDLKIAWLGAVATFAFGAVHAAFAGRALTGRHGSSQLSVRADLVDRHLRWVVVALLLVLAGVTIAIAVLAQALGASHPVTIASVVVAITVLLGGPRLMNVIRRRSERSARA